MDTSPLGSSVAIQMKPGDISRSPRKSALPLALVGKCHHVSLFIIFEVIQQHLDSELPLHQKTSY